MMICFQSRDCAVWGPPTSALTRSASSGGQKKKKIPIPIRIEAPPPAADLHRTDRRRPAPASGHGPRRPPRVAAVDGLRLPQLQLRDGRLPLLGRPLHRRLRPRRLRRPPPPLPLPPPARAPQGPPPQARRLGPLHAPHAHVLVQGRRHDAALGTAARLGPGDPHHRRWILRLLRRPPGGALTLPSSPWQHHMDT